MDHFWAGKYFYGHAWHALTSFTYMKEWCRDHYNSTEEASEKFYDNCAIAHINNGANPEIMPQNFYLDFQNPELTTQIEDTLCYIQYGLIGLGILLYLAGVKIAEKKVMFLIFLFNFLLSLP
jgi:hypothetical protein